MPKKSKYGIFFNSIHSLIYKFLAENKNTQWTKAEYLKNILGWHPEFSDAINEIKNPDNEFLDNDDKKIYSAEQIIKTYGVDVCNILNLTLEKMYNEKGALRLLKEKEKYVFQVSNDGATPYFRTKTKYNHYSDINFYDEISSVIEYFKGKLENIDGIDGVLCECLKISYKENDTKNDEFRNDKGKSILEKYGNYGLLFLVVYYSLNGNMPEMIQKIKQRKPNIFITSKADLEKSVSLKERLEWANRIIMICYAGTSFLANKSISTAYDYNWYKYYKSLIDDVKIDIVLVDPNTKFYDEMVKYKMKPRILNKDVKMEDLIRANVKRIIDLIEVSDGSDINLYFADFSMTLSYFQCIFPEDKRDKDNIKIDLYLPNFSIYNEEDEEGNKVISKDQPSDAELRQSFIVKRDSELYAVFDKNIQDIISNSKKVIINSRVQDDFKDMIKEISEGNYL